jgi:hypothetical protein
MILVDIDLVKINLLSTVLLLAVAMYVITLV